MDVPEEEIAQDGPDAEQVRREVAYLARLQREVIIMHYLQGKKVSDITVELGIPKGTVLSRLSSGRAQMKKGMEFMERYEKKLYAGAVGHQLPWAAGYARRAMVAGGKRPDEAEYPHYCL